MAIAADVADVVRQRLSKTHVDHDDTWMRAARDWLTATATLPSRDERNAREEEDGVVVSDNDPQRQQQHASTATTTRIHRALMTLVMTGVRQLERKQQQQAAAGPVVAIVDPPPMNDDNFFGSQQGQQHDDQRKQAEHAMRLQWQVLQQLVRRSRELRLFLPVPSYTGLVALISQYEPDREWAMAVVREWGTHVHDTMGVEALQSVLQSVILDRWIPLQSQRPPHSSLEGLILAHQTVQWTLDRGIITYWSADWAFDVVMALRQRLLLVCPHVTDDRTAELPGAAQAAALLRALEPTLFCRTMAQRDGDHQTTFVDALRRYPNAARRRRRRQPRAQGSGESDSSGSDYDDDDDDEIIDGPSTMMMVPSPSIQRIQWELTADLRLGIVSEWVEHWIHANPTGSDDPAFDPFTTGPPTVIEIPVSPDGSFDEEEVSSPEDEASVTTTTWVVASDSMLESIAAGEDDGENVEPPNWEDLYQSLHVVHQHSVELPDLTEQWKTWMEYQGEANRPLRYHPRLERILLRRLFPEV